MAQPNRLAADLDLRENQILAEFGRGDDAQTVAGSAGMTSDQLEDSILDIMKKLHAGAMRTVLGEPASYPMPFDEAVVEPVHFASVP